MAGLTPKSFEDKITEHATDALKNIDKAKPMGIAFLALAFEQLKNAYNGTKGISSIMRQSFLLNPEPIHMVKQSERERLPLSRQQLISLIDYKISIGEMSKKQADNLKRRATQDPQGALDEITAIEVIPQFVGWMLRDKVILQKDADMYLKNPTVESLNTLKRLALINGMVEWMVKEKVILQKDADMYLKNPTIESLDALRQIALADSKKKLAKKRKSEKDDAANADKLLDEL